MSVARYAASLRDLEAAVDAEIERVEELRGYYAQHPTGTIVILTTIAPALGAAKTARAAGDVDGMREAYDALREIE